MQCAVPETIHTPPTEGIGISWAVGFSKTKYLNKCIMLNLNFQRGGVLGKKFPLGGGVGSFWNCTLPISVELVRAAVKVHVIHKGRSRRRVQGGCTPLR